MGIKRVSLRLLGACLLAVGYLCNGIANRFIDIGMWFVVAAQKTRRAS